MREKSRKEGIATVNAGISREKSGVALGTNGMTIQRLAVHLILIVIVGLLVYSNTFHVPFVFDDESSIYKNILIKDSGYFTKALPTEILTSPRIIGQLTFALNYKLHGLDVFVYHVLNLLIHLSSGLLVYWLVRLTFRTPFMKGGDQRASGGVVIGSDVFALFCALLFVSHPVQTQAVTYIVQRYTSLATLFYLLSLVLYIKSRLSEEYARRYVLYGLSFLSALLAMKTKEIAFTLPVVIVLYEFMFLRGDLKKRLIYLIPMLLTMAIIPLSLALRMHGEGAAAGSLDEITKVAGSVDISRWDYLNTQFRVIVTYIRLLFLPINQNLDYDYPIYKTFFTPPVFFSFLFLLAIFGWGVYLLYRSSLKLDSRLRGNDTKGKIKTFPEDSGNKNEEKYWYRLIAFGIFWFFVTISVESSVIPILDVIFEHRLYLPSVGFFMAIMASVMWFTGRWVNKPLIKKAVLTAMILAIAVFSATAYARNGVWRDEVTLWEDIMKRSPNKARPNYNLGLLYSKLNRIDEAIILYQTAIQISPNFYRPYNDLGNAYFNKGRLDDALREYQTAVTLNPDYAEPYNNIGIVYAEKGRYEDAIREFQTALQLKPNYADAHANLGNAYYQQGHFREAIIQYQDALKLNPDHRAANNNLERLNKSGIVKKIKENP